MSELACLLLGCWLLRFLSYYPLLFAAGCCLLLRLALCHCAPESFSSWFVASRTDL